MAEALDLATAVIAPPTPAPAFELPRAGDAGPADLTDRAVLLHLTITSWGVDRRLQEHQYQVDANKRMTRARKKLLQSSELDAVHSLDNAARDWVAAKSLPSPLRQGVYLQPLANLEEVDAYILDYCRRRRNLVELFLSAYPGRIEEARGELRSLFDARNYPPVPALRSRFTVSHSYLEAPTAPGSLRSISAYLFHREQEKARESWEAALEEARSLLRSQMAELVQHLVERLQPGADGKPKVFLDSLVRGMEEWLSDFSARNLAQDGELSSLVERARELLQPAGEPAVSAQTLRSDEGMRSYLRGQFEQVQERIAQLVMERPSRRIRLED